MDKRWGKGNGMVWGRFIAPSIENFKMEGREGEGRKGSQSYMVRTRLNTQRNGEIARNIH